MLIVVQFPIADARGLRADPRGRLTVPDWPSPRTNVNRQFVRRFGPAEDRRQLVDRALADEHAYCRAARAIVFTGRQGPVGRDEAAFVPAVAFRRLFVDVSGVVGRVEVGLASRRRLRGPLRLNQASLLAALTELLELDTHVPVDAATKSTRLMSQGPLLARLYRRATTSHQVTLSKVDDQLVEAGDPLVVVVLEPGELVGPLDGVRTVSPTSVGGASISFGWFKHRAISGQIGVWYIEQGASTADSLRLLRLCLLRLHAERECLDSVLRQIRRDLITLDTQDEVAKRIQRYLNRATRVIAKESWNNLSQSAILEAFDAAVSVGEPDEALDLAERLDSARSQIAEKVLEYAQQRSAPRVVEQLTVEGPLQANDIAVEKAEFALSGMYTTVVNRPSGPVILAGVDQTGRNPMTEKTASQQTPDASDDGAGPANDPGGDTFTFRGQNTTFINRPRDVVLSDFQNSYIKGDGSTADQVNEQLKALIGLIHDSKDLPDKDREETAQAVTNVAEQVKDNKANGLTVKGVMETVGKVLETAADIAPTAAGIVASVIKIFAGI
jgi:hypothetical protein